MDIQFQNLGPAQWKADVMLLPACEEEALPGICPEIDKAVPWLTVAPGLRDFKGKKNELALLHGHPDLALPRVLAIGLGKKEKLDMNVLRKAVAAGVAHCRKRGLKTLLLPEPGLARLPGGRTRLVEECVCAALLGLYRFSQLKKKTDEDMDDPSWLAVGFDGASSSEELQNAARMGESSAWAVSLARDLASTPPNLLSPHEMGVRAQELSGQCGFTCTVLDEKALAHEGMGGILAVGQGSSRPPRLVVIEHVPDGGAKDGPLVFVGKGITFDSGGICIKPSANMDQMKADMMGAACVLAAVATLARERSPRWVAGVLACAENLPGGGASRPGDVVRLANGDWVEFQNTDAEGRMVLADALCYAQKRWTPAAIVDIATLTGACAIALGKEIAGMFCDDAKLAERLRGACTACGEPLWPMPLWEPYKELLKSEVADISNMGKREGGAITAALFLKHFVKEGMSWAHLDVAGVDWAEKTTPLCPKGPTGFGTRTLLELARGGLS